MRHLDDMDYPANISLFKFNNRNTEKDVMKYVQS